MQSALAKTYAGWARVRLVEDADAYVRAIVVNTNRSRVRRRRVREALVPFVPDRAGASVGFVAVEDRAGRAEALATLPPRQRAAVVLRYCEDLSAMTVAEVLGCSVGTVKSQAARGLAKLRSHPALAEAEPCATP